MPTPRRAETEPPPIDRILGGAWVETAHGRAFVREEWYPQSHPHGAVPLSDALAVGPAALALLADLRAAGPHGLPPPSEHRPRTEAARRLGFFDIETTGLAGGTGTYVVLAGIGTFERDGFRLRQYFLADVAAERAMLGLLAEDLARCDGLVTYNGRAFDVPVTDARLTLVRLPAIGGGRPHLDLLHSVRRLYRHRMQACTLAEAERRLLHIERFDDVPGAMVPSLYFDYVRAGRAAPMRAVFRHNAEDVLSLVGVLARLGGLLADPSPAPDDAAGLARWCELVGDEERARSLYRCALPWLEGGDDWAWAAARQARLCRRAGANAEAAVLWTALWDAGDTAAGLALAKHLEHRARDYSAAGEVVRTLLARANVQELPALRQRLARIEGKARRARVHAL